MIYRAIISTCIHENINAWPKSTQIKEQNATWMTWHFLHATQQENKEKILWSHFIITRLGKTRKQPSTVFKNCHVISKSKKFILENIFQLQIARNSSTWNALLKIGKFNGLIQIWQRHRARRLTKPRPGDFICSFCQIVRNNLAEPDFDTQPCPNARL